MRDHEHGTQLVLSILAIQGKEQLILQFKVIQGDGRRKLSEKIILGSAALAAWCSLCYASPIDDGLVS